MDGAAETPVVGLFGAFDTGELGEVALRRVIETELGRRRPDIDVVAIAPYGAERPVPTDEGRPARPIGSARCSNARAGACARLPDHRRRCAGDRPRVGEALPGGCRGDHGARRCFAGNDRTVSRLARRPIHRVVLRRGARHERRPRCRATGRPRCVVQGRRRPAAARGDVGTVGGPGPAGGPGIRPGDASTALPTCCGCVARCQRDGA